MSIIRYPMGPTTTTIQTIKTRVYLELSPFKDKLVTDDYLLTSGEAYHFLINCTKRIL